MTRMTTVRVNDRIKEIYERSRYTYRDGIEWFARELMRTDRDFIEAEKKRWLIRQLELEEKKKQYEIEAQKIQVQLEEIDIYIQRLDKMLEKPTIPYELYDGLDKALRIISKRMEREMFVLSPYELETAEGKNLIEHLSCVFNVPQNILKEAVKEKYGDEND